MLDILRRVRYGAAMKKSYLKISGILVSLSALIGYLIGGKVDPSCSVVGKATPASVDVRPGENEGYDPRKPLS